ncbi:MAG: hypothetical protein FWH26_06005 [Oscillospiraceae bacterium]|nr:hypothetical protein [Oscillospiraceae bacterium]
MTGKPQIARIGQAAALLAVLLCLSAPAARAAPLDDCAAGRHQYAEVRRVAPTAMEDGEVDYICGVCGKKYTDLLFATDHIWGQWVTERQPNCTQPGASRRTCSRAQPHSESAVIPALGHDYTETVIQPGCDKEGLRTFDCARCGHQYTQRIDPLGQHSFGGWHVEIPAEEGVEGLEVRVCAVCGAEEPRILAALPPRATEPPPTELTTEPLTELTTELTTEPPAEPPAETAAEPPDALPVADIVLVSANVVSLGSFAFVLIPYFLCLAYAKRRRKAIKERDALRKEVDNLYGFK